MPVLEHDPTSRFGNILTKPPEEFQNQPNGPMCESLIFLEELIEVSNQRKMMLTYTLYHLYPPFTPDSGTPVIRSSL